MCDPIRSKCHRSTVGSVETDGPNDGTMLHDGSELGWLLLGPLLGSWLGSTLGSLLGWRLGSELGSVLGSRLGSMLGSRLGPLLGSLLGSRLGTLLGSLLGSRLGTLLGWLLVSVLGSWLGHNGEEVGVVPPVGNIVDGSSLGYWLSLGAGLRSSERIIVV